MSRAVAEAIAAGIALYRSIRRDYEDVLRAHIDAAEEATRGVMLTSEAQHAGRTIEALFRQNDQTAQKWASEELREFWATHPRPTFARYEDQYLDGLYREDPLDA